MKKNKFIIFIFLMIASMFLYACSGVSPDEAQKVIDEVHEWVEENVKEGVAADINLPTTYPDNSDVVISWSSGDSSYIDDQGRIGERDRKLYEVYFTYTITYGEISNDFEKVFKLCPRTLEEIEIRFTNFFPKFIARDIDITTVFNDVITVTWWSSNQEVFTNEGKYIKPLKDTMITISYIISDGNTALENSFEINVQGKTAYDYFVEAQAWLENDFIQERFITEDLVLPTTIGDNEDIKITWTSSNENIISSTGKVTKTIYERYVKLTAKLELNGSVTSYDYSLVVEALDLKELSEQQMLEEFINNIAVDEFKKLLFNSYGNITQSYGFIHFYSAKKLNIVEDIIPLSNDNRPGEVQKKQYITVHDTANNAEKATAYMHSDYVKGGGGGTSWHYSIDENDAYHHIPNNETAYHAGDGSRYFALVDTGIKATAKMPIVTLQDGFYYINGQNTKLRPYSNASGTTFTDVNYETTDINKMGVYVEVGENGNWYMGKTYFNDTYDLISNFGGNKNGIGIESCVNATSDYGTTMRHLAMLCAYLCVENDLPVSRVYGHHYFSGKGCPNQIMNAGYWEEFKNLIALEKFALDYFSDYTFTWTSLSKNIDSIGRISLSANAGDVVSYKVSVKNESGVEVLNNTFNTTLK